VPDKEERRIEGKAILCERAAHNIKKTIMANVKEAEGDISSACAIFHKKHEEKTGKPILTISEFEQVTKEFSKLSETEIQKLIKEGKEEHEKRSKFLKEIKRRHK